MKTAVITGAGRVSGIGAAIAVGLADDGFDVVIADRDLEDSAEVVDAIAARGQRSLVVETDVSSRKSVEALFATAKREFGDLHGVVANAGIAIGASLVETTEEEWQLSLDVNLTGVFYTLQSAAVRMIEDSVLGSIVVMGSAASKTGWPRLGAYSASKFGVIGLMQSAAQEWGPYGIRVNAICPGGITTTMASSLYQRWAVEDGVSAKEFTDQIIEGTPLRRLGTPSEIADAARFLLSDKSRYITGESLNVTGGSEVH